MHLSITPLMQFGTPKDLSDMKSDTVFKQTFNDMLALLAKLPLGQALPSENDFSARLGVSRTTVRKALALLDERELVGRIGNTRIAIAPTLPAAHFPLQETVSTSEQVESHFMEWMLRADTKPGTLINELELAREFNVGTTGIREFLNRFQRFGLIEKRRKSGWLFKGFTQDFAMELFEIRQMFEPRSAQAFARLPNNAAAWATLEAIEAQHHELLETVDTRFHDFSELDNRFHRLVNAASPNRFIDDFYDIITLIFHYHYQWNKRDERGRNATAIREHLNYIAALKSRDAQQVNAACSQHLASAKTTMLAAFSAK